MLLLSGILAGCNEAPAGNKGSTKKGTSTSAVNVDATDWPRTFKDALGKLPWVSRQWLALAYSL